MLVVDAGAVVGLVPLLGIVVTVHPVTGGLLSCTGGVHVTVMDEPEVAMAVTPPGGGGTALVQREKEIEEPFARYWLYMETYLKSQLCLR